jgi:hypothetical protein
MTPMQRKIIAVFDRHPDWTGEQIGQSSGCTSAHVSHTLRINGRKLCNTTKLRNNGRQVCEWRRAGRPPTHRLSKRTEVAPPPEAISGKTYVVAKFGVPISLPAIRSCP